MKPLTAALIAAQQNADQLRGSPGPEGAPGTPGTAGDPGLIWRGPWTKRARYNPRDVVEHDGSSWTATKPNRGDPPPSDAWDLVAKRGANGQDGQGGPRGIPGPTGPQGPAGSGDGGSLPPGGTTGQVLTKESNADGDADWEDPTAGSGAVDSVNGFTGVVVLTASDVGADATGAAAAAQAASQPLDSDLTAFAGLAIAADKLPYGTGSHTLGLADLTAAGRALIDDADASAQRTTLGLGTLATQSGTFSGTSSGTNTGDQTLPVGGTPAVVLASSASAGSSPNFLRRDDTIAAFDATAPTTQAFGDSAAVGTAAFAARRDHKHAMMALPAIDATGAATDITTRNVSTSAHGLAPKLPNDATKYLDGTGAYSVPAGGGGGAAVYSFPFDTPPGSAHAKDDEFGDASGQSGPINGLDAKWTNPLSSGSGLDLDVSFLNGMLVFEPHTTGTSSTGKHLMGIRQSAPASSFTVTAKVATQSNNDDDCVAGIFVARTSGTTSHHVGAYNFPGAFDYRHGRSISTATYSETADGGGYDGGAFQDSSTVSYTPRFCKLVYDASGSTLTFYLSGDGMQWTQQLQKTSISQPDRIGLALYSNSGTIKASHEIRVDWFRVTEP